MHKQIYSGKTKEEATEEALKDFNVSENDLLIREISPKKSLFAKKVEIEVVKKEDLINFIKEYLLRITKDMGFDTTVEIKNTNDNLIFDIKVAEKTKILIGKLGKNIQALQVVTNQMIYQELNIYFPFLVDIDSYRQRRQLRIEKLAKTTAKEVARSHCEIKLDPMNAYDRRIVHNILSNRKDVSTKSEGEEPNRYIIIRPKEDN